MASRVAIAGKPLAGKSTLARLMKDRYGYRHASMSAVIVQELSHNLNAPWMVEARGGRRVEPEEIIGNKEQYRASLQVTGDDLGFQDPEKIIQIMHRALLLSGAWNYPGDPVVLEAIRGDMQASAARALGFIVVELWVDSETQFIRSATEEGYWKTRQAMENRPDIESGVSSASVRLTPELSLENQAHLLHLLPDKEVSRGPADQPFTPGSFANWGRV